MIKYNPVKRMFIRVIGIILTVSFMAGLCIVCIPVILQPQEVPHYTLNITDQSGKTSSSFISCDTTIKRGGLTIMCKRLNSFQIAKQNIKELLR